MKTTNSINLEEGNKVQKMSTIKRINAISTSLLTTVSIVLKPKQKNLTESQNNSNPEASNKTNASNIDDEQTDTEVSDLKTDIGGDKQNRGFKNKNINGNV